MHEAPLVSVIIPVKDDAERLQACLSALAAQTFEGPVEVIVVDNGSADPPVAAVAPHAAARLLEEHGPSSYAARNRGAEAARGEILAFTDSDCLPDPDWLRNGVSRVLASPRDCFVGGRIDTFPAVTGQPSAVEVYEMAHAFPQHLYVESGFAATANLLVARHVFSRVGGFDVELTSGGDMEWGQRARAAGVVPVYAPDVRVAHPARRTLRQLLQKLGRTAEGHAALRERRDEPLPIRRALRRLCRPPVFSSLRRLPAGRVPARVRAGYLLVAVAVHYTRGFHQIRLEMRTRARRSRA